MPLNKRILTILCVFAACVCASAQTIQSSGAGSGNWNDPLSWTPNIVPTSANSTSIVIFPGHTIHVNANFTVDQLTVNGALVVNTGSTLTLANGTGTDIILGLSGTLQVAGTLVGNDNYTFSGLTSVNTSFTAGSTYRHLYRSVEGSVPLATWNATSTLEIAGFYEAINATAAGNWSQSFGHVVYNSSQGPNKNVSLEGLMTSIQGNLSVLNTGLNTNNTFFLSTTQNVTVNIGGSVSVLNAAKFTFSQSATNFTVNIAGGLTINSTNSVFFTSSGRSTVNLSGDYNATGHLLLANATGAIANFNLSGHFNMLGGSTIYGKGDATPNLNFIGSTVQNFVNAGTILSKVNLTVAPSSTVNFGTNIFNGQGNFIISGTIQLGSTDPAGAYQNGTTGGNIRNSAARTFNTGSVIAYNGLAAQVITLHPSTAGAGLTIANPSGVSMTGNLIVNGSLTFQSGTLIVGAFTLTATGNVNTIAGNIQTTSASTLLIQGAGTINSIAFASSPATIGTLAINRAGAIVLLSTDLTVTTALSLSSNSIFNISGRSLTISGNYTASANARIAASSTSNLTISSSGTINAIRFNTGNANLNNWTINRPGGSITLGTALTVHGILNIQSSSTTLSGSAITLASTNDSPTQDGSIATLLTGSVVNNLVTVNRYMSAEGDMNRYISSPVTNATVASLQDDFPVTGTPNSFTGQSDPCTGCISAFSLRYYNETALGVWTNTYQRYPFSSNTELLQVGRGYVAYMWNGENQITWDVSGPINQGTIALPVSLTLSSPPLPEDDGWNLVGNPYPSTIRWDDVVGWTMNNIAPIVYVTDNSSGVFRSWNPIDNTGDLTGGLIATGQAFWVFASGASPSLSIHETAKAAPGGGAFYRERSPAEHLIVSLQKNGNSIKDNSFLILNEEATMGYDQLYEIPKLPNEKFDVALRDGDNRRLGRLAYKDLDTEMVIPVSVRVTEPGDYTLSFTSKSNFRFDKSLKLVDKFTGKSTSLSGSYSFKADEAGAIEDRFVLTFNGEGASLENSVSVYPNPVVNRVEVVTADPAQLALVSALGQTLEAAATRQTEDKNRYTFEMERFTKGIYYIQIRVGAQLVTRKIIKQ